MSQLRIFALITIASVALLGCSAKENSELTAAQEEALQSALHLWVMWLKRARLWLWSLLAAPGARAVISMAPIAWLATPLGLPEPLCWVTLEPGLTA